MSDEKCRICGYKPCLKGMALDHKYCCHGHHAAPAATPDVAPQPVGGEGKSAPRSGEQGSLIGLASCGHDDCALVADMCGPQAHYLAADVDRRWAEREAQHAEALAEKDAEIARLADSVRWGRRRLEMLQHEQKRMRDPERTVVCDILANGSLLPDPNGTRYGSMVR